MSESAKTVFHVDVVSDVVCPWCYIGKRRLAAALATMAAERPDVDVRVNWHPFQLNPDLPPEGIDRRTYVANKFGGPERAAQVYERVRAAGATAGIALAFDRIERQPNTLAAHRLVSWAQARGAAAAVVEALFRAYFLDGRYVGDRDVLADIAGEAGLDREAARTMLATGEGEDAIRALDARVRELGVDGVPFFIFGDKVAVSGAQQPDVLADAMRQALAADPVAA